MSIGIIPDEEVFDDNIGPGEDKPEDALSMEQEIEEEK